MTRKGALVAAGVVIVFNAATLALVAANRSAEPAAVLELTERELWLPPREAENTALVLRLKWVDPELLHDGPGWFDRRKLEEIGFDCRPGVTQENRQHYQGLPPRVSYAVLEYEGEAWNRYLSAPASTPRRMGPVGFPQAQGDPAKRAAGSHLVLADVGNDPAALRARYPDRRRSIVVPVAVALTFVQEPGQPAALKGRVMGVLPGEISVPRELRPLLESLQGDRTTRGMAAGETGGVEEPRYRATVNWGRFLEPWLADVRPADNQAAGRATVARD